MRADGHLLRAIALLSAAAAGAQETAPRPASVFYERVAVRDRVAADGSAVKTIEARVQLRDAAAVAQFGQILIPYVDGFGQVAFDSVTIEKADGRSVDARNGRIEDINPFGVTGTSVAADVRFKKLTLAGLEPGDALAYRVVVQQKALAPGRAFGEMKFNPTSGDPTQTYELDLPKDAGIQVHLRDGLGATWEEVPSAADRLVRRLKVRPPWPDVKEKRKEAVRLAAEPDVAYSAFRSWDDVAAWWWSLSEDRLQPDASIRKEAGALLADAGATPRARLEALHRFVAARVRYLNVSFGIGRMQPRDAGEVLADKYGDCKDKLALLAALAASVGIDVRPVLVHTLRDEILVDLPGPQQFDHMIGVAKFGPAEQDWVWLDPTNAFSVGGYLNPPLRDKQALVIEASGTARLVRTPAEPPFVPKVEVSLKGRLDPDGSLRGHFTWLVRSDGESLMRAAFAVSSAEQRTEAVRTKLVEDWKDAEVTNVSTSDPLDSSSPFRLEFDVEKPPADSEGAQWDLWIPLPEPDLPDATDEDGEEDATFGVREVAMSARIEFPEGLSARAPLSVTLDRPFGRLQSTYSVEAGALLVSRSLSFPRPKLSAEHRAAYQAFLRSVKSDRDQKFAFQGRLAGPSKSPAQTAYDDGLAAFRKKEYSRAAELLQQAATADPKLDGVFEELGKALRDAGRDDEAIAAFTRQIEIDPFHEYAYSERAHTLIGKGQWDAAEPDLLKQIEVAPFRPWSYERLATLRLRQRRFREAAEYYARAAALDPKEPDRWANLAWALYKDGQAAEARAALERLVALDPPDWLRLRAGNIRRLLGDVGAGGELASAALPSLAKRLAGLSPQHFGKADIYWVDRVCEAWLLIGLAAQVAGDEAKAERYLDAAWKLRFDAEAAWALGELRQKQGRLGEALDLMTLAVATSSSGSLPADWKARVEALRERAPESAPASERLMRLRTISLGSASETLSEEVLVLIGRDGSLERVKGAGSSESPALKRQLAAARPAKVPIAIPDDLDLKVVRRGLLACTATTTCALFLEVPGSNSSEVGSVRIVEATPAKGTHLRVGQRVDLRIVVEYDYPRDERGSVGLVLQDQDGRPVAGPAAQRSARVERGKGRAVLERSFEVPAGARRIDAFTPLRAEGQAHTSTVDMIAFTVE